MNISKLSITHMSKLFIWHLKWIPCCVCVNFSHFLFCFSSYFIFFIVHCTLLLFPTFAGLCAFISSAFYLKIKHTQEKSYNFTKYVRCHQMAMKTKMPCRVSSLGVPNQTFCTKTVMTTNVMKKRWNPSTHIKRFHVFCQFLLSYTYKYFVSRAKSQFGEW